MDYGQLFSRAWKITWKYKVLWIFGILASCATSSTGNSPSGGFNFPSGGGSGRGSSGSLPPGAMPNMEAVWSILAVVIVVLLVVMCVALVLSILGWVVGVLGRGALVAGAQQAEGEGGTSFSKAWTGATARFVPLFGMNVLLALPTLLVGLVVLVSLALGLGLVFLDVARLADRSGGTPTGAIAGIALMIACLFPLACLGWIYNILAGILRLFAERAIVLEGRGAIDGLKRGWAVFRANLGNALVLGIILVALTFVLGIALALLFVPVLVPIIIGVATAAQREAGPSVVMFGVGGCIFVIALAASTVVNGILNTFGSACWTLAYRDFAVKLDQSQALAPAAR